MAAYLDVVGGRLAGRRYALGGLAEAVIGRDESCEVSILDESASRRHAAISRRGERFFVRDLGSRNGTLVNGEKVAGEAALRSDDEILVGATRLRFIDEAERARDTAPLPLPAALGFRVERALRIEGAPEPEAASGAERRLRSLLSLGRLIATISEPRALLAAAIRALPATLAADRAVALPLDAGAPFEVAMERAVIEPPGPLPGRSLLERALGGEEALLLSAGDPGASVLGRDSVAREGVRAVIAAPMPGGGRKRGVLYVDRLRSGGRFEDDDLAYLAEVARQLGAALAALDRTRDAREEVEAWRRLSATPRRARVQGGPEIVGDSPPFRAALDLAERAARSDAPVLILGETGSGKELFARLMHDRSYIDDQRSIGRDAAQTKGAADRPFVALNCAALPEALLESELFGHERGAFTGADRRRRGLFELASGGTLFLDEVGEMALSLQSKLLRALETREIRRLGGEEPIQVDVRVLAATNRDLSVEVREKRFREDLYYRLAVLTVRVPALRERLGDAEKLALHFLRELDTRGKKRLGAPALTAIRAARWPGNVRELRNALERAVALSDGDEIGADLLISDAPRSAPQAEEPPITIEEAERRAIVIALKHTGGKKGEAARILGIAHPTLNRKLKDFGLEGGEAAG